MKKRLLILMVIIISGFLSLNVYADYELNYELSEASQGSDAAKVQKLIVDGANINFKDTAGFTPLHWAAELGKTNIVKVLVANRADINSSNGGITPLHFAANKEIAELLIANGANVNAKADDGTSPLHLAATNDNVSVARVLIEHGADVNAKDKKGVTPLDDAIMFGKKDMLELIVSSGADIMSKDKTGETPLHYAAYVGNKQAIELLIAKGAEVNIKNNNGHTPLHYAKDKSVVDMLVSKNGQNN
ncbi:MAG: ankyrin repeat domain-containing protein [Pseudomonadota bacterium]|nr:ankyrin repeat domain-containing protein [Pseudomonadota bacterium]